MPRYHFQAPSVVDDVSFFENEKGTVRAYLHASEGTTDNQLAGITALLRHHNMDAVPYDLDGKPVLEVRGFGKPNKLLTQLQNEHIVTGSPAIEQLEEEHVGFKDKLSKRTLQLSGAFQLFGDIGYWKSNQLIGNAEGSLASYLYALGTYALIGYGRNDQSEIQIRDLAKGFERYIEKKGDVIPEDSALRAAAYEKDKNPLLKFHEFNKRYPSEIYNAFTGLAGAMVALDAYKNKLVKELPSHYDAKTISEIRGVGKQDVVLGLTTFAACMYGILAKEKTHDPDEPEPTGTIAKTIAHFRNNPLAVTGAGLMVSTVLHGLGSFQEYKAAVKVGDITKRKAASWRGLFFGANVMAEILLMASSKGHGHGVTSDDTVHKTAYKMAAEVVLHQPEEKREYMINYMSDFLEQPDVLAEKHDVVVQKLTEEVAKLKDNPWVSKSKEEDQPKHSEHMLVTDKPKKEDSPETWVQKVSMSPESESAAIQPSISH